MTALEDRTRSGRSTSLLGSKDIINSILPPELFSKIFEIGTDMDEETSDDTLDVAKLDEGSKSGTSYNKAYFNSLDFASLVSQICSTWREIALSTPTLWGYLYVADETPVEMITTWLDRSKAVPLDIEIDLENKGRRTVHDFMPFLITHISRWRSFRCHMAIAGQILQVMAYLVGKDAPALEVLTLDDPDNLENIWYKHIVHSIFAGPGSLPKLKFLTLWSSPMVWASRPFANLVYLQLGSIKEGARPTVKQFVTLLQGSPTLESLLMSGDMFDPDDPFRSSGQVPDPITLDYLQHLIIKGFKTPSSVNHTLRLFNAPRLIQLDISDLCFDSEGEPLDFSSTFDLLSDGVFPKLEMLRMAYVICANPRSLEGWFCNLTRLQKLNLVIPRAPTDDPVGNSSQDLVETELPLHFLRAFVPPKLRSTLELPILPVHLVCPVLEEITASGIPGNILVSCAEARKSQGVPLKRIMHDARDKVNGLCRERLEELGVELTEYEETCYGVESDDDEGMDEGIFHHFAAQINP
ncbi:hypothetical protein FRB95_010610 [Tulasnella sp. JGI-2019a]|nr:hypothetical protein FRB95_010610 [Tulasnella sp. JGI-2019a]